MHTFTKTKNLIPVELTASSRFPSDFDPFAEDSLRAKAIEHTHPLGKWVQISFKIPS